MEKPNLLHVQEKYFKEVKTLFISKKKFIKLEKEIEEIKKENKYQTELIHQVIHGQALLTKGQSKITAPKV